MHFHACVQLHTAEQLREEVRLERDKLSSKEARLAGLEAALEATRREMDRQAAEVAAAMQVGRQDWAKRRRMLLQPASKLPAVDNTCGMLAASCFAC
jgi:hypothetical protein